MVPVVGVMEKVINPAFKQWVVHLKVSQAWERRRDVPISLERVPAGSGHPRLTP